MMKRHKTIHLNEAMLRNVVKASLSKILKEGALEDIDDTYDEDDVSRASSFTLYFDPNEGDLSYSKDDGTIPVTIYPIVEADDEYWNIVDFDYEIDTQNWRELESRYGDMIKQDLKDNFKYYKYHTKIKLP